MFHPSTERLIDYWRSKAVNDGVPARASVNPGDFLDLLPQVSQLGGVGGRGGAGGGAQQVGGVGVQVPHWA